MLLFTTTEDGNFYTYFSSFILANFLKFQNHNSYKPLLYTFAQATKRNPAIFLLKHVGVNDKIYFRKYLNWDFHLSTGIHSETHPMHSKSWAEESVLLQYSSELYYIPLLLLSFPKLGDFLLSITSLLNIQSRQQKGLAKIRSIQQIGKK